MKNRPLFHPDERTILERSINTLTLACEALESNNKKLLKENEKLSSELTELKSKLIVNGNY